MSEHYYVKVRWRSGDALDCKSNQPGSTPGRTSTPPNATLPSSQHRPASAAFIPAKWCTIVILSGASAKSMRLLVLLRYRDDVGGDAAVGGPRQRDAYGRSSTRWRAARP